MISCEHEIVRRVVSVFPVKNFIYNKKTLSNKAYPFSMITCAIYPEEYCEDLGRKVNNAPGVNPHQNYAFVHTPPSQINHLA